VINEPKRLFEDGGELGQAIGAARRKLPTRDNLGAVASGLSRAGVVLSNMPAPRAPSAAPAQGVSTAQWLAFGAAGTAAAGLVVALLVARTDPKTVEPPNPPVAATIAAPPVDAKHELGATPALPPSAVAEAAPSEAAPRPAETAVAPTPRGETLLAPAPAPAARSAARPDGSEIELLKLARNALGSDPAETLALVDEARRKFPNSSFGQEREFLSIAALTRVGRSDEAKRREQAFRAHYPRSAYLPQLDRLSYGP